MRAYLLAAMAALSLSACNASVDLCVLAPEAKLIADSGDGERAVKLGARLRGRPPSFLERDDAWRVRLDDRWYLAPQESLVRCPLPGEPAYVIAPSAVRLDRPGGKDARGVERYPIGKQLTVARSVEGVPPAFVVVLGDGAPTGFVLQSALGREPPDAARLLDAARAALLEEDEGRAGVLARQAMALEGDRGEAARLLSAILIDRGDAEGWHLRKSAGLPPAPKLGAQRAVEGPGEAWVAASGLNLRAEADPKAKVRLTLPIASKVEVVAVRGEWAEVKTPLVPPASQVLDMGPLVVDTPPPAALEIADAGASADAGTEAGEGSAEAAEGPEGAAGTTGFVAARFLDGVAPDADKLVQGADEAQAKGRLDEGVVLLERAQALRADDVALATRLFRSAVEARRYEIALPALRSLRVARLGTGQLTLDVERVFGCRVDPTGREPEVWPVSHVADPPDEERAPKKTLALGLADAPRDLCVTDVPRSVGCPPQGPGAYELVVDEPGLDEAARKEAERAYDEAVKEHERELAAFEARRARLEVWVHDVRKSFPSTPWIRVSLENRSGTRSRPATLVVYGYTPGADGHCGNIEIAYREDLVRREVPVPPLAPREKLELRFRVDDYHRTWGAFVGSASAAAEFVREQLEAKWPWPAGPGGPFDLPVWTVGRADEEGDLEILCEIEECGC